jgi:hypothetical protein
MTHEDAFLSYLKVYNFSPLESTKNNSVGFGRYKWLNIYMSGFKNKELKTVINDEFKSQAFINNCEEELSDKLNNLNLTKKYRMKVRVTLLLILEKVIQAVLIEKFFLSLYLM